MLQFVLGAGALVAVARADLTASVGAHAVVVVHVPDGPALERALRDPVMAEHVSGPASLWQQLADQWQAAGLEEALGASAREVLAAARDEVVLVLPASSVRDLAENPESPPSWLVGFETGPDDARWKDRDRRRPGPAGAQVRVQDGVVWAGRGALPAAGAAALPVERNNLQALRKRAPEAALLARVDFAAAYPQLLAGAEARDRARSRPDPLGFTYRHAASALGLDALRESTLVVALGPAGFDLQAALEAERFTGLFGLPSFLPGPVVRPGWIPEGVAAVTMARLDLGRATTQLEELADDIHPLLGGLWRGQIESLDDKTGLDTRAAILGQLTGDGVMMEWPEEGPEAGATSVLALRLRDPAVFADHWVRVLQALNLTVGPEEEGVRRVRAGEADAEGLMHYGITEGWLYLARPASRHRLRDVAAAMAGPGTTWWRGRSPGTSLPVWSSDAVAVRIEKQRDDAILLSVLRATPSRLQLDAQLLQRPSGENP